MESVAELRSTTREPRVPASLRLVAQAILFQAVRSAAAKADWYESGYLANITAYALAKLSHEIKKNGRAESFDLLQIWQKQEVGEATLNEAVKLAREALTVLTDPRRPVANVTEWAKREAAWIQLAAVPWQLSQAFLGECLPVKTNAAGKLAMNVGGRFPTDISVREHIKSASPETWGSIRSYFAAKAGLSNPDKQLLKNVTSGHNTLLDLDVARGLLALYVRAINDGWLEPPALANEYVDQ